MGCNELTGNLSKDGVFVLQLGSGAQGYEELGAVVVLTSVGHRDQTSTVEPQTRMELILIGPHSDD